MNTRFDSHANLLRLVLRTALACALVALPLIALAQQSPSSTADSNPDNWIRPGDPSSGDDLSTASRWGHRHGLQVGLSGAGGPHGLLYLYHDPIVQKPGHPINFIAIEPIVDEVRCYSELEPSKLDGRNGKRFWSADGPDFNPRAQHELARGVVTDVSPTSQTLSVYVMCEPFVNGARVHLRLTFRSGAPDELDLETFSSTGSAPIDHCILSATMGNFARLRELHLRDPTVTSHELWPDYRASDFAPANEFSLPQLARDAAGAVLVRATPDEPNPAAATAPGHWNYVGARATQYWRLSPTEARAGTLARVNGRYTYWLSRKPIPGGISFENFELQRPFISGEKSTYGVTTSSLVRGNFAPASRPRETH